MNAKRIFAVVQKEWWEIVRDPLTLVMAFGVPIALLLLVGFGMTFDVENIPLALVDQDGTSMSRDYAYRYIGSRYFDFKGFLANEREATPLLMANKLRAVVIIPEHFERNLKSGYPATVQVILDGGFPDRARIVKGYISAITGEASMDSLASYMSRTQGMPVAQARQTLQPLILQVRYMYNQSLKSDWSVPPKLIMFILFFTPAFMTSLRVVREKELGSIFNIYTSPLTRIEFIVGKLAPYIGIALVNLLIMLLLVMTLFGVPFKGSFALFFAAGLLYVIATTGIGMLVSVFVRTQIAAMLISLFITFVPALQYSGLEIPIASMGADAQVIAHLMPGMYFVNVIDGSFLKGVGLSVLWPSMLSLTVYATVVTGACYWLFHKRVRA